MFLSRLYVSDSIHPAVRLDLPNWIIPFKGVCRSREIKVRQTAVIVMSIRFWPEDFGNIRNRIRETSKCSTKAADLATIYVHV